MLSLIGKGIVVISAVSIMIISGGASISGIITASVLGAAWMFLG